MSATRHPLLSKGDLDGFFGLMVDNLVQVLLIVGLCQAVVGLPAEIIYTRILPGIAVSLLLGNLFYGLQARHVARRDNNPDCTALPYGINTPSVIAFVLFVMAPVARQTGDPELAWKAGLLACLVSGLVELFGAFVAERLRRVTPRAALLGVLAAIGIVFLAGDFAFRIYTAPLVGILPLALLLLAYLSGQRFPLGLPGGLLAIVIATAIAWSMTALGWADFGGVWMDAAAVRSAASDAWDRLFAGDGQPLLLPTWYGAEILELATSRQLLIAYLTVSIPMGVINLVGSLQNIESAEAGGDRFATAPSLAVNGLGSIAAGLFGSCFPTTIYIGHPGWKALGARSGYSILNGLFFAVIFICGLGQLLGLLIPIEAGAAIVLYIGILITAQAFQVTPRPHAPAIALGFVPAIGAVLVIFVGNTLSLAGADQTLADLVASPPPALAALPGAVLLTGANSSWIVLTLILTAASTAMIDRQHRVAAGWFLVAGVLTALGLLHAYRLDGNTIRELFLWQAAPPEGQFVARAWPVAVGYLLAAGVCLLAARGGAERADLGGEAH